MTTPAPDWADEIAVAYERGKADGERIDRIRARIAEIEQEANNAK